MIDKTISHYKIIEKLGEGGMGVVYKAADTKLKRTVALKFQPPEYTRDPEAKKRFIQEAQAYKTLYHSNVFTIHENDDEGFNKNRHRESSAFPLTKIQILLLTFTYTVTLLF